MSEIKKKLFKWSNASLEELHQPIALSIKPLREEASFRRYFRLKRREDSIIGVYSPPEMESNKEFIFFSQYFKERNINVPNILKFDLQQGFILLEDFGDDLYQFKLNTSNRKELYELAIKELIKIHSCKDTKNIQRLTKEHSFAQMNLFEEWFLQGLLGFNINDEIQCLLDKVYDLIEKTFINQPQVLCHFDFESRNLILLPNGGVGVLDYQDAILGPIFLDPVSLLKDLNCKSTRKEMISFLRIYTSRACEENLLHKMEERDYLRYFDFTGLQRQLRILGTLSRLHLRDKKSYRLPDLIKTLDFLLETSSNYAELKEFNNFLKDIISPELNKSLKEKI